jgi:hypothetical protein
LALQIGHEKGKDDLKKRGERFDRRCLIKITPLRAPAISQTDQESTRAASNRL